MREKPGNSIRNTRITHLFVWSISLVLTFFLPFRFARFLALDFETLVINLAGDWDLISPKNWYVNLDWIPAGKFLILFGALPLFLVITAGFGYRLIARFRPVKNPFADLPARARTRLALLLLPPFAAFCVPFSLAFSVWLSVETFWWIQWYERIEPTMSWLRTFAPWSVGLGTALLGIWALRFSLPKTKNPPGGPFLLRVGVRLACTVPVVLILAAFAPSAILGAVHASRLATVPGRGVFEAKCGSCHDLVLSLYYIKTPIEWRRTIDTQINVEKVKLTPKEKEDVIKFLVGMRSFSDEWTFRTRCRRCHVTSYRKWEKRPPEDWAAIAKRHANWSPYYYRPDVRNQIADHLGRTRSRPDATLGLDAKTYAEFQEVGRACSACHSISIEAERYRGAGEADVRRMIERMSGKTARPMSESEIEKSAASYLELISDPLRFDHLFPHDRPVLEGGPPW